MHALIQRTVDIMIILMGGLLAAFTAALIILHFVTSAAENHSQRLREQIMQLLSVSARIERMRGRIHRLLELGGEAATLRSVRGVRSQRGLQVLELVSKEIAGDRREALRRAVEDPWFGEYLDRELASRHKDSALIATKLIAQLDIQGRDQQVEANLRRWQDDPDAQQICLLAFFARGQRWKLVRIFSDPDFRLILSFRTIQELCRVYSGDHAELYKDLMASARDPYIKKACIHGIGQEGLTGLSRLAEAELDSESMGIRLEAVRAVGRLKDTDAAEKVRALTEHPAWEMRCAAVDALYALEGDGCGEAVLKCLYDREWWVRFHAASVLVRLSGRESYLETVRSSGDAYACEMFNYMLERDAIMGGGRTA